MLIENADYFVRLVPFPPGVVDGFVVQNGDGTFSVYLDANADEEHRRVALEHELNHIRLDHFHSEKPKDVIEREADTGIPENTIIEKPKQDDWLSSWQRCMEWARQMQEKYGSDPPPADYLTFATGKA